MIVTEQKPFSEVVKYLKDHKRVFVVGCGSCATAWHTGGADEVREMAEKLRQEGKEIIGTAVIEESCDDRKIKKEFRAHTKELEQADALLVMACGAGTGAVTLQSPNKPVYPALNSLYLARVERLTKAEERCVLCGECILGYTAGICPMATCPKGLLNGACGGSMHGRCEVDPNKECAWAEIYNRLERLGQLDKLEYMVQPKDHMKWSHPRRTDKTKAEEKEAVTQT